MSMPKVLANPWHKDLSYLGAFENLPAGSVRDILIAQNKSVWFAYMGGLVRFDGYRVKLYKQQKGQTNTLPSNDVYSLAQDSQGRIWVATNSRLSYLNSSQNSFTTIAPQDAKCDVAVKYIKKGQDDSIWGISETGTLVKYDASSEKLTCYTTRDRFGKQVKEALPWSLIVDDHLNGVWLSTEQGLEFFDIAKERSKMVVLPDNPAKFALTCSFKDSQGQIWLGSYAKGIIRYNPLTQQSKYFSIQQYPLLKSVHCSDAIEIQPDEYWFAAKEFGVVTLTNGRFAKLNGIDQHFQEAQLDYGAKFNKDDYGNVWIATPGGAFVQSKSAQAIEFMALDQTDIQDKQFTITSITIDNNNQLFISTTKGIYQIDSTQKIQNAWNRLDQQTLPSHRFAKIMQTTQGAYYLCSSVMSYQYNETTGKFTELHSSSKKQPALSQCVDFQQSKQNPEHLWIASHSEGLALLDTNKNHTEFVEFRGKDNNSGYSSRLMALIPEHHGKLWIASADNGFGAMDLNTRKLTIYTHQVDNPNSIPNNMVTDMLATDDNILWLTTFNGLSRFDITTEQFSNYGPEQGLSSDMLGKILQDSEGDLWVSSIEGLNLVNPKNKNIRRFYQSKGLLGSGFNINAATKDHNEKLYFANGQGISRFDPLKLKNATSKFDTFISNVSVDNQVIKHQTKEFIELDNATRDIVIDFAMTAYASVKSNRFRYYLQGYDLKWREQTSQSSMTFSNLPSGDYTFRVQGKVQGGQWSQPAATFSFTIATPYYLTPWAFAAYLLFLFIFIKLVGLYYSKAAKEKARLLQQKVDEQTVSLQQSHEKISKLYQRQQWLFTQLSHEIRTPITLMMAPLTQLVNKDNHQHQKTLKIAQFNQNRLIKMLDQLLAIAQSTNLTEQQKQPIDVKSTLQWITHAIQPLIEQKQQQLLIKIDDDAGVIEVTKDALEKILLNLLSNANKYTPAKGIITLQASQSNGKVSITVADNGIGIAVEDQNNIFECFERAQLSHDMPGVGVGLAVVKQLLAVNDGHISLRSELNKGSEFTLTFSLSTAEASQSSFAPSTMVKSFTEQLHKDEINGNENVDSDTNIEDKNTSQKPTLLLAEDNQQMRRYVTALLSKQFNILTAKDGQEAIELAMEHVPDIILSDVMMPKVNGYQLLEHIKSHPVTNHIAMLLLTAKDDPASRLKGLTLKADDYIAKPFNANELQLKLNNILNLQTMWHQKYQTLLADNNDSQITAQPQPFITIELSDRQQEVMVELEKVCQENYHNNQFKLADIADKMKMTERQLQRKIKAISGLTPIQILKDIRLSQAKCAIESGEQITQVAYSCGFSGYDYFSRTFKEKYQMSPKTCQQAASKK